ncbi:caspase domain-containing protein [Lasiosphaeria hispida]|uniref:Caspase domain-containing protein n=1 Tax=Lasiosphaeria hispida TaxID=260671 RepID=A0AAJ0HJ87_9PEZI|nr:caspase domain-containing protein [Lasiosphaeria hispida]
MEASTSIVDTSSDRAPAVVRWALLIGANFYMTGDARTDAAGRVVHYHNLRGCVNDIALVECFLKEDVGLPAHHITKLTSTKPDDTTKNTPAEDAALWPTYQNIARAVGDIRDKARPGDLVYIHYSGHGARVHTVYGKLKGPEGIDEALVPVDIEVRSDAGADQARYVRDVELAGWLQELVDKGLRVTVVLDSCHAGSSNRGQDGATSRGTGVIDFSVLVSDGPAPDTASEAAAGSGGDSGGNNSPARRPRQELLPPPLLDGKRGSRDGRVRKSWLLEASGYTFLAACTAYQRAHERAFDVTAAAVATAAATTMTYGVLTYYLVDALRSGPGAGLAPSALVVRVAGRVQSHFADQTPLAEGEDGSTFFGVGTIAPVCNATVLAVDAAQNSLTLAQGSLHGVHVGAEYVIYQGGGSSSSSSNSGPPLPRVRITHVLGLESVATFIDHGPGPSAAKKRVGPGDWAVLAMQAPEAEALVPIRPRSDRRLLQFAHYIAESRKRTTRSLWRLLEYKNDDDDDDRDKDVALTVTLSDGCYELQDAAQVRLPDVPRLRAASYNNDDDEDDEDERRRSVAALAACIDHVAQFQLVQRLAADRSSALRTPCRFELVRRSRSVPEPPSRPGDFSVEPVFAAEGGAALGPTLPASGGCDAHAVGHGDVVVLTFRNDGAEPVYLTVLDLKPLWGIERLYPAGAGRAECVGPGEARHLPILMELPAALLAAGRCHITETFRAVVTQRPAALDLLELPDLDDGTYRAAGGNGGGAAAFVTGLDRLLEELAPEHRDLKLRKRSGGSWQTYDIRIRTVRDGPL